jgi:hypothetical protein
MLKIKIKKQIKEEDIKAPVTAGQLLSNFDKYIKRVNLFGGQYKYRWGDMEIINLFFYAFYKKPIYDFKFGKDVYIDKVKEAQPVYHSPFTEKYNLNLNSFYYFYLKIRKLLTYKFFYNFLKIN